MTDTPERIWAVEGLGGSILSFNDYSQGGTEYVRADLVAQAHLAVCDATVLLAHALDDRQIDNRVSERFDSLLDALNAAATALRSTREGG